MLLPHLSVLRLVKADRGVSPTPITMKLEEWSSMLKVILKGFLKIIFPRNFTHVITSVKNAAGYDLKTYQTPSLALKIGHGLKKI